MDELCKSISRKFMIRKQASLLFPALEHEYEKCIYLPCTVQRMIGGIRLDLFSLRRERAFN